MISRRDFLQAAMATSAIYGGSGFGSFSRLAAQQALTQDQLLEFETFGNVSLIHVTDIHAQMKPIWFREPQVNLGVGANKAYLLQTGTPAPVVKAWRDSFTKAMADLVIVGFTDVRLRQRGKDQFLRFPELRDTLFVSAEETIFIE